MRRPDRPRTRKRPKELVGTCRSAGPGATNKPQSLVAAGFLARRPCDLRTWFPGPSRGSLLDRSGGSLLPLRARRNVRAGVRRTTTGLSTNLPSAPPTLSPNLSTMWTGCGYSSGRCRIHGSSARAARRRSRPLGAAARRLQPSLAERPVPADPADQGPAERPLARTSAPRGVDRHPDRPAPRGRHPRPRRPARGSRHRARGDDRVHDPRGRCPAWRTTPTPTARPGRGPRPTRR